MKGHRLVISQPKISEKGSGPENANWVMHEYSIEGGSEFQEVVVCRIRHRKPDKEERLPSPPSASAKRLRAGESTREVVGESSSSSRGSSPNPDVGAESHVAPQQGAEAAGGGQPGTVLPSLGSDGRGSSTHLQESEEAIGLRAYTLALSVLELRCRQAKLMAQAGTTPEARVEGEPVNGRHHLEVPPDKI